MGRLKLSACALLIALCAAPTQAEDLLDTYRLARDNDASFASARAQLQAGLERLPQGRALLLPVISGSLNTQYNDSENRSLHRSTQFNSNGWDITLTQPLFRWQNVVQYQQAGAQVQQAEAVFGQATQDLIVRVAQAYFDVLAAEDSLQFLRANKTAIAEQLAQAKRNFEVGTATITDTNEAQARYDLSVAQEIAATNALEVARRALEQITNRFMEHLTPLKTDLQLPLPQPNDMTQWADAAQQNNFSVRANQAAYEVAMREIERQRAGHYPTIDVVASYQQGSTQNPGGSGLDGVGFGGSSLRNETTNSLIGLQLNVPIFEGGAVNSRTREAVALRDRARNDFEAARRSAEFNARQSFLNVNNGRAQVQALEQALTSSETALQSNKVGYEVGVRINIDVLNAQQQVFQTQRDLSRARYDTIVNGLKLKAASGSLTEQDVVAVNQLLVGR